MGILAKAASGLVGLAVKTSPTARRCLRVVRPCLRLQCGEPQLAAQATSGRTVIQRAGLFVSRRFAEYVMGTEGVLTKPDLQRPGIEAEASGGVV